MQHDGKYEIKLTGLSKKKDGTYVTFVLHQQEDNSLLELSHIGQAFLATFTPTEGGDE